MSKFANKQFWFDTFDRVVASFAQGFIAASGLDGIGLLDLNWIDSLSLSGSYALLSLLTSVAFRGNGGSSDDTPKHSATEPTSEGQTWGGAKLQ